MSEKQDRKEELRRIDRELREMGGDGDPAGHRAAVESALAAGKPVPAEVLVDYPDMASPVSVPTQKPYRSPGDLAAEYRTRGMDRHRAWDQFVIDTVLSPRYRSEKIDARDFFRAYDVS